MAREYKWNHSRQAQLADMFAREQLDDVVVDDEPDFGPNVTDADDYDLAWEEDCRHDGGVFTRGVEDTIETRCILCDRMLSLARDDSW